MLSFNDYNSVSPISEEKENKAVVFTFGRFQPLHKGHEKVINLILSEAARKKADAMIFPSHTQDKKKNPLFYHDKIRYIRELFPEAKIINDTKIKNPFHALKMLSDSGYKDVTIVVGSDRVKLFEKQVHPYIKHEDPAKSFEFDTFKVIDAGERNNSISATQMREFAKNNDFISFSENLPSASTQKITESIYNDVKNGIE